MSQLRPPLTETVPRPENAAKVKAAQVHAAVPKLASPFNAQGPSGYGPTQRTIEAPAECQLKDMPESVLDGRLGEICATRMGAFPRAYAWPALLAVASAMIDPNPPLRTNLYVALVGPVGSGKSQAIEHAINILGIESPTLMKLLAGSGEQLVRHTSKAAGNPRLFSPDELGHLLEKMQIQRSSFSFILNQAFYEDKFDVLLGQNRSATYDCVLSIVGGMVDDRFQDLFNAGTTGGVYDRFLFGQCPGGYNYDYFPFEGMREFIHPSQVTVDRGVWEEKRKWLAEERCLNSRIPEIAIRAATVCAAFDGRKVLYASNLSPARELARYQTNIRRILKPNPGENFEARIALKFLNYLSRSGGKFVSRRDMFKDTRAYNLGPSTADRALSILHVNGEIEIATIGKQKMVRLVPESEDATGEVRQ